MAHMQGTQQNATHETNTSTNNTPHKCHTAGARGARLGTRGSTAGRLEFLCRRRRCTGRKERVASPSASSRRTRPASSVSPYISHAQNYHEVAVKEGQLRRYLIIAIYDIDMPFLPRHAPAVISRPSRLEKARPSRIGGQCSDSRAQSASEILPEMVSPTRARGFRFCTAEAACFERRFRFPAADIRWGQAQQGGRFHDFITGDGPIEIMLQR